MKTLFAFAFLICISVERACSKAGSEGQSTNIRFALNCYKCISTKSWSYCASNKREMLCPSNTDTCVKLYFGGKVADTYVEGFFKECGSKSLCNQDLCKVFVKDGATIDDCEVNCCDGDLCNGAKAPMVSVFLLLACALVAWR